MLKGLEVSEVMLSKIDLGDRFDAEYFTKENIQIELTLQKAEAIELRNFATFVASAFYPAATQLYEIGDTPFIRCVDCINHPLITKGQDSLFEKIPLSFATENKGISILDKNDIVITKVGSPCFASIVYEHDIVALSRTVMGLKDIHGINPFYLLVFLRSKYGFSQLLRARELTIQYQLTLERVKKILVYVPEISIQKQIEKTVHESIQKQIEAQNTYNKATDLLLTELGLLGWQPNNKNTSLKHFLDFLSSGRLDAEYYQPKYDELEAIIKKSPYRTIAELQTYNARGVQPDYLDDGEISVINSKHILESGLDYDNFEHTTTSFLNGHERARICYGDILIYTTGANIGRAQVYLKEEPAVASNHVNILRVEGVNPVYLAIVINSQVGRMQTEKLCTGSAQAELYPTDIEKFVVPILPDKTQQTIADYVQKSVALCQQAKQLLEDAKKMVEQEIEKQ